MALHSFDVDIAEKLGVHEAIVVNNLSFWILKNQANNKHFYDGYYWTYNSAKAFSKLFPYWNEKQIYRLLRKLCDLKVVKSGNFNKVGYDRTKWYTIIDESICLKCKIHFPNMGNGFEESVQPIPDIKPDSKPDSKPDKSESMTFQEFWDIYDHKKGVTKCKEKWSKISNKDKLLIKKTLHLYISSTRTKDVPGQSFTPLRKNPLTYLNQRVWDDYRNEVDLVEYAKAYIVSGVVPAKHREAMFGLTDYELKKLYLQKNPSDTTFDYLRSFQTSYLKEKYDL